MKTFCRDDGRVPEVVEGFRERILSYRRSVSPRRDWQDSDYAMAAEKKRRRFGRLLARYSEWGGQVEGARVLDVGCGDATNCLLLGLEPVREAAGIDLRLSLFAPDESGERCRALAWKILQREQPRRRAASRGARVEGRGPTDPLCSPPSTFDSRPIRAAEPATTVEPEPPITAEVRSSEPAIREALAGLPVRLTQMDATRLDFPDENFDWLLSRSAMEHIRPVEQALEEMVRVVRPGGLIYLSIDPFYWVRGCHKRGVVDIPFAHARLTMAEYRRFVCESEGDSTAAKREQRLETLNRFTLNQWREMIEAQPWDILDWDEAHSRIGEEVLEQYPDILATLLPGVEKKDLLHERIRVWLRKRN